MKRGPVARAYIGVFLAQAQRRGDPYIDIRAGEVLKQLWPGEPSVAPSVCGAMIALMAPGDWFVYRPPNGLGRKFTIRYRLPRPAADGA